MRNNLPIPDLTENDVLKIRENISVGNSSSCWEWIGCRTKAGYGRIKIQNTTYVITRLIYFLTYNVDPGPLLVLHTCDNPPCCNTKHLWLGDDRDNSRDRENKNRGNRLHGELCYNVKLSENDILTIRYSTSTDSILSEQFNIARRTIGRIRQGKMWKHVGGPIINRRIGRPSRIKSTSKELSHA